MAGEATGKDGVAVTRDLWDWRQRRTMEQRELAEAVGVKLSTLRTWEQGVSRPRAAAHRALAAYFNIAPCQITFNPRQPRTARAS